jgi:hypothetical protein
VEHLDYLRDHIESDTDRTSRDQIRYFALSVLAPQMIRRRITDEFVPERRTLTKKVTLELDLDHQFEPFLGQDPVRHVNGDGHRPDGLFIAVTLPRKGALYDRMCITDGEGRLLPSLSHLEYRVLAARTLRVLLRSAFADGKLTLAALKAERLALTEIVRFAQVERKLGESSGEFSKRQTRQDAITKVAFAAIKALEVQNKAYLALAVEFVAKLARSYAIVTVVPADRRLVICYERTIIPSLSFGKLASVLGIQDRIRMFLGAHPVFLTVSARNAVSCGSYHLIVSAGPDLYLGDFDTTSIRQNAGGDDPTTSTKLEPYWRVRGRRGQNYFHLYTRSLRAVKGQKLTINVKFYEVPPGSIGRAGMTAAAACLVVLAVGFLVSRAANMDAVDSQIASFLLAIPGIAAAWMGFEARPGQLLEGTLVARISLMATFVLALSASVVLLLNKGGLVGPTRREIFVFGVTDPVWSALGALAVAHMLAICGTWWLRNRFYRSITTRPVHDSAVSNGR